MGGQQPPPAGPFRVAFAAAAAADVAGGALADLGEHVVGEADQVEPVGDHHRVREGVSDRPQVRRGPVDGHVGDAGPPRIDPPRVCWSLSGGCSDGL